MRISRSHRVTHRGWNDCTMGEKKPEPLDFVRDFQEYLNQQTHHVNMISGPVDPEKEPENLQEDVCEGGVSGLGHASIEVSLDDGAGVLADGFERTDDGKLKCHYCEYASRGVARLVEHIRIHTGEKPHRCHLCPFASAYERHLEAHMRSHTGEKPYKCELCSFRCSDRSNLSHHRRRRHKVLPAKGTHLTLTNKKMLTDLQESAHSHKMLGSLSPPSIVVQKPDYANGFPSEVPCLHTETYDGLVKARRTTTTIDARPLLSDNPLEELSTLAGQLASLPSQEHHPPSLLETGAASSGREEKPVLISQAPCRPATPRSADPCRPSTAASDAHAHFSPRRLLSPTLGPCSDRSAPGASSWSGTPAPASSGVSAHTSTRDTPQTLYTCPHCSTYFADNILYTIHMGCHGYDEPFQCNVCGSKCRDKYDFACHFARGQHQQ
ncbi:zinc finger protein Pegasus-like [Brachyhypopomus gauderio]|uniref:zinc finger protein Pegasus-like n=1 Tax=Brachyhypopomus gauderio TaxID=698409 RepID=UPI0040425392